MNKCITFCTLLLAIIVLSNCAPKVAKKQTTDVAKEQARRDKIREEEESKKLVSAPGLDDANTTKGADEITDVEYDAGKSTYMAYCGKCHALYQPPQFTAEKWTKVMPPMAKKAHLDKKTERAVLGFVLRNCKK